MNKKIIGIFICTLLISIAVLPVTSNQVSESENVDSLNGEEIEYPEEDGPYTVYIGGSIGAWAHSEDIDFDSHILPFWYLNNSQCLCYDFQMFSLFYVNGSLQNIKYPARICLFGFKGFAPTFWLMFLKWFIFRNRIIGRCDSIFVYDNMSFFNPNQIRNRS